MRVLLLLALLMLTSCSSVKIQDFKNEKPALVMEEYFKGEILADGVFLDRSGMVKKRFTVVIKASWDKGVGTLDEDFTYSDGTKGKRVWTLVKRGTQYIGTASDVDGEAVGEVVGNTLHWEYDLNLPVDDKVYKVHFDDWMYLMTDKTMLNQSKMSKFGIHLGQVILSFRKL